MAHRIYEIATNTAGREIFELVVGNRTMCPEAVCEISASDVVMLAYYRVPAPDNSEEHVPVPIVVDRERNNIDVIGPLNIARPAAEFAVTFLGAPVSVKAIDTSTAAIIKRLDRPDVDINIRPVEYAYNTGTETQQVDMTVLSGPDAVDLFEQHVKQFVYLKAVVEINGVPVEVEFDSVGIHIEYHFEDGLDSYRAWKQMLVA